jgi:hypothetical protein
MEGRYPMLPNLPRPSIHVIDDHACVRLHDCVANLLGHGFLLNSIQHPSDYGREHFRHRAKLSDSVMACNIFNSGESLHFYVSMY